MAVAVRHRDTLYVADDLMDAEGIMLPAEDEEDEDEAAEYDDDEEQENPEEVVGEFRNFLDTIRPEDFSP